MAGLRKALSKFGRGMSGWLLLLVAALGCLILLYVAFLFFMVTATAWQGATDAAGVIPTILVLTGFAAVVFTFGKNFDKP